MNREERRSHRKQYRKFYSLLETWGAMSEADQHSEQGTKMMQEMLCCAPEEISRQLHAKAQETGLFPTAKYRDADGNPMYTEYDIAEHLGIPVEEVRKRTDAHIRAHGESADIRTSDLTDLHPVH